MKPSFGLLLLLGVLGGATFDTVRADWIRLKDGVQFHGTILRESDREITLRCDSGGTLTFRTHQIETIHRTTPPTPADGPADKDTKRSGVEYDPKQLVPPEEVSVHSLDQVTVRLPKSFVQTKRRQKLDEHTELVASFEDSATQATVSLQLGKFPTGSESLDAMSRDLRQKFLWTDGYALEAWERCTVTGRPALYAEMRRSSHGASGVVVVQTWIEVEPGRVLTVTLTVAEEVFRAAPPRYRQPFGSLLWVLRPDSNADRRTPR